MTWAKAKQNQADEVQAWAGVQPMTAQCLYCDWKFVSLVDIAKAQARAHREQKHPELVGKPRRLHSSDPRMEGPA